MKTESTRKEIDLPQLSEEEQKELIGGKKRPPLGIIDDGEIPL